MAAALLLSCLFASFAFAQPSARTAIQTRLPDSLPSAIDTGPVPSSQRLSLTLTLAPSAAQAAALDRYLSELTTASSPNFHHWLTPQQFAATYAPAPDRIAAASSWLAAEGLSVDAVSPSGMRLSVSGFAARVEAAFATKLDTFQINGHLCYANIAQPSLPADAASFFAAIDGLDDLPDDSGALGPGLVAKARAAIDAQPSGLSLQSLASVVDANASPTLSLDAGAWSATRSASQIAGLSALFRQAAAQGITTFIYGASSAQGFPSGFPETTSVAAPGATSAGAAPIAARPAWQFAPGLPADGLRDTPDIAASLADISQAVSSIQTATGGRLGNINPVLYALAPTPGLFTHPDSAAAGAWQPATGLGVIDTAKLVKAYPHGTGTSTLSVVSSNTSPTHGQSFYLTVSIASTNGGGMPTGVITFSATQSAFLSSSVPLTGAGTAQSVNYTLPGGSYNITATYSGDSSYASTTASINVTVQPEAANFQISAPASVSLGGTLTAVVTLSSASGFGTPSGSVLVTPSGITSATPITQTLTGSNGTASGSYAFATNQAGSVSLQASCTSLDPSFTCFTPQSSTTTVPQATPSIALTVMPTNPMAGAPVTMTAAVSGVAGIGPTGSVQFFDGTTSVGFGSAPNATFTGKLGSGTSHAITAVYQGDSNYLKATSNAVNLSVGTVSTTTSVNASALTASYGQSITLNITVVPSSVVNGTQPTGTLSFTGAGAITSSPVSGGSANITLNNLAVGTYTIGTSYSGDANYAASTGNNVVLTITPSNASLNASLSSTSFTTGSTSTLTVTVTLPGSAQLAPGNTFIATIAGVTGATYTGTFAVNTGGNTGTGSATIPAPAAGTYQMQITCGANANFTCTPTSLSISSTSTTGGGSATGTTPTTTVLTYSPLKPAVGQTITLTATVSAAAAAVTANPIAGKVSFFDGTMLLGTASIATVGANGVATATVTLTGTMAHSLTATYQGNTVYAASTSAAVPLTLAASAATLVLTSNVPYTVAGTSVVLTATITGTSASGAGPMGIVSFYIAGPTPTLIGTATVGSASPGVGTAVFSTSNLPSGSLSIYATYAGDANFGSTISNTISLGLGDYNLVFVPSTLTVSNGTSGTTTGVVTLINNFSGTITLACAPPLNFQMSCGFNPTVLTAGGSTTLTVTTTAPKTASNPAALDSRPGATYGLTALGALLGCLLPTRRRGRLPGLLLLLLAFGLTMNLGCSGNNFSIVAQTNAGTPLGTTLLNVTTVGTSGANTVRHNYTFQVTVQ
jgi:hypothetical protein